MMDTNHAQQPTSHKPRAALADATATQPADLHRRGQGYYASIGRQDGWDELTIHAPNGRDMAYLWYRKKRANLPGVGPKAAKAAVRRIVNALNAYQPDLPARPTNADPAQAGGTLAFAGLAKRPRYYRAFATTADTQLIADALNAY